MKKIYHWVVKRSLIAKCIYYHHFRINNFQYLKLDSSHFNKVLKLIWIILTNVSYDAKQGWQPLDNIFEINYKA